ncbi:MAG: hypothetical protein EOM53_06055 [Alphaproteobacteria bacterium]|nr:hypothetical protein [Alphaproteobacteria bacterium]
MEDFSVKVGDIFEKMDKVPSQWVVDKILLSYRPEHVRLIEKGGNSRTSTVALQTLLDEKYWKQSRKVDTSMEDVSS